MALEIACGRRTICYEDEEDETRSLVEWVWDLYRRGKLIDAADLKLGTDFNQHEMKRLLALGLWCAHPDSKLRPSIRQAIQVLNFEAQIMLSSNGNMPMATHLTTNFMSKSSAFPLSNDDSHCF